MKDTPAVRLLGATDGSAVFGFLSRLSPTTLHLRYLTPQTSLVGPLADREAQRLLDGDADRHVVVVADDAAEIRGIGEFVVDPSGESAELALVVEDRYQRRGIGQMLYAQLEQLARQLGIAQFTGDVAYGNPLVLRLLRRTGQCLRLDYDYAAMRFTLTLARQVHQPGAPIQRL